MMTVRAFGALILVGLAACGSITAVKDSVTGLLKQEEDNSIPPVDLIDFEPTIQVVKIWSDRFGKGVDNLFIQLIPAAYKSAIYTADRDGRMIALSIETGEQLWLERNKKQRISGGPGVGDGLVFVGTSDAEVVARDVETGEEKWIAHVSSEVLAAPRAADGTVVVRTGDGKLFGLDSQTGNRKWVYDRTIPVLTLRGTSAPVIYGQMVIAGFDNGRLVALDLATGKQEWETRLGIPSGRSDLERMVDVDSEPTVVDETAYVASFQGNVAAVSVVNGQMEWTREISSHSKVAVDELHAYVTDEFGTVWALERNTGVSIWKQEGLKARRVTGPAVIGDYVVVGDFEGYLHWIDRNTGEFVHRLRLDKKRILVPCRTVGNVLLAFSSSGVLAAFRPE
ncbi:MAG: outer membrane protein assembly factor BamB [Proteobacteria bacterium]|nr:MAG: outer membrane protein assembly factor BamB [Pseudomonadota bacterium]